MSRLLTASVVEDEAPMSLAELARACRAAEDQVEVWVVEGVLEPTGLTRSEWRFAGTSLARARRAASLARDLEINPAGIALALDLMDEVAALRARLRRIDG